MSSLVVFDSSFGNTEKIAVALGIGLGENVRSAKPEDCDPSNLGPIDLLIVGSPTQGGRPTPTIKDWLGRIPSGSLKNVGVAAFDTRFDQASHGFGMRLLLRLVGFAAPRIAIELEAKGGTLLAPPEGFIVEAKEGPLREGELDRARAWARSISAQRP